ncbi:hypothetical protein E3H11_22350 [Bradyrhizobium brasilense]|uniref:hypothetical protein n=1 Tax=Bradyrhizobium brasilense TaxID=1419277 RepID=UPI0014577E0F|nr:hypothetical protein [Bradyrhizobium brasilense]NLS71609.1 hypothetical protein [Bradyrhizobium brasilense]
MQPIVEMSNDKAPQGRRRVGLCRSQRRWISRATSSDTSPDQRSAVLKPISRIEVGRHDVGLAPRAADRPEIVGDQVDGLIRR